MVVSASDDSGIKKFVVKESIGGNTATELYSYSAGSSDESGSIGTVVKGEKVIFVQKDYGRSDNAKHFDKQQNKIIKSVIDSKDFKLEDILHKINKMYIERY